MRFSDILGEYPGSTRFNLVGDNLFSDIEYLNRENAIDAICFDLDYLMLYKK